MATATGGVPNGDGAAPCVAVAVDPTGLVAVTYPPVSTVAATATATSQADTKSAPPQSAAAGAGAAKSSVRSAEANVLEFDDRSHLYSDHLGIASDPHLAVFFASLRRDDQTIDEKLLYSDTALALPVTDAMLREAKNPALLIAAASAGAGTTAAGGVSSVPTSAALRARAQANQPESISFVVSNLAIYSFPPQIIVPAATAKPKAGASPTAAAAAAAAPTVEAPPTKFMVYNSYKRYALSDIMLTSLPYRSGESNDADSGGGGGGGGDYALRTNDFVLHVAGPNRTHVWFQTRPGARSQVVEVFCDAYKSLLSREVELQNPDCVELLTSILDQSIDSYVRDTRIEYWAAANHINSIAKAGWLMVHIPKPEPVSKLTATTVTVAGNNSSPVKPAGGGGGAASNVSPPPAPKPKYEWRRRWCVLARNSYLLHFADPSEYEAFRIVAAQKFSTSAQKQRSIAPFFPAIGPIDLTCVLLSKHATDNPQTIHATELLMEVPASAVVGAGALIQQNCIRYVFRVPREAELPAAPSAAAIATAAAAPTAAGTTTAAVSAPIPIAVVPKRPSVTTLSFAAFFASEASPPTTSTTINPAAAPAATLAVPDSMSSARVAPKKRHSGLVSTSSSHAHDSKSSAHAHAVSVKTEKKPSKERQFEHWYAAMFHCLFPASTPNMLPALAVPVRASAQSVSATSSPAAPTAKPAASPTPAPAATAAAKPTAATSTASTAAHTGGSGAAAATSPRHTRAQTMHSISAAPTAAAGAASELSHPRRSPSPVLAGGGAPPPIPPKTKPVPNGGVRSSTPPLAPTSASAAGVPAIRLAATTPAVPAVINTIPLRPPRPSFAAASNGSGSGSGSGIAITTIKASDSEGTKFSFKTSPPVLAALPPASAVAAPTAAGSGKPPVAPPAAPAAKSRAAGGSSGPNTPKATTPSAAAQSAHPFAIAIVPPVVPISLPAATTPTNAGTHAAAEDTTAASTISAAAAYAAMAATAPAPTTAASGAVTSTEPLPPSPVAVDLLLTPPLGSSSLTASYSTPAARASELNQRS